jgi:ABC-type nitrate/sulfonate/bicarbonate transport system substrate-binding protein
MLRYWLPSSGVLPVLVLLASLTAGCAPTPVSIPSAATALAPTAPAGSQDRPSSGSTAGLASGEASAADPLTINYGWQLTAFSWPSFVARDKGFFRQVGVDPDVILIGGGGTAATQLLVSGGADVVSGGPETTMLANDRGEDAIIIGAEGQTAPHRVVAGPGITSVQGLKGKLISVPDLVQGATIVLQHYLAAYGLTKGDYDLVASGGSQNRFAALTSGAVDATILAQPLDFQAVDQGYVSLGLASDVVRDWLFTVYSARRSWATANGEAATRFIRGLQLAGAWLYDPQNREEAIAILRENTNATDLAARRTYDLYVTELRVVSPDAEIKEPYLRPVYEALVENGQMPSGIASLRTYYDNTYVERARRP